MKVEDKVTVVCAPKSFKLELLEQKYVMKHIMPNTGQSLAPVLICSAAVSQGRLFCVYIVNNYFLISISELT